MMTASHVVGNASMPVGGSCAALSGSTVTMTDEPINTPLLVPRAWRSLDWPVHGYAHASGPQEECRAVHELSADLEGNCRFRIGAMGGIGVRGPQS